jgi:condensation domain-containing protein
VSGPASANLRGKLLTRYLEQVRAAQAQNDNLIVPRPPGALVEASEAQQQIWLHSELAGEVPVYNEPVTVHYNGQLDVQAFESAFNEILRRHEALRTCFVWRDDKLLQIVEPEIKMPLPAIDLRKLSNARRENQVLEWATRDAKTPFNLQQAPLLRARLFRMRDAEYRLYLTLHHIIFDGVSLSRIFLPELKTLYSAYSTGVDAGLEPVRVHYPDYSYWRRQSPLESEVNQKLCYWNDVFSEDAPELRLPMDRPRPEIPSYAGAMVRFAIPEDTTDLLKRAAQACKATLHVTLLSAFHVLLYHYTGDCDQSIGIASSTRKHTATMGIIGYFLNTVVLRTKFLPEDTFTTLVTRVREVTVNSLSHDDVPFSRIVSQFDRTRKPGLSPLFQVMFSLQPPLPSLTPEWGFTQMDIDTGTSKFDLHLELDDRKERLIGRFIYSTTLFDEKTIRQMAGVWLILLAAVAHTPQMSISQLSGQLGTFSSKRAAGPDSLLKRFQKLWK